MVNARTPKPLEEAKGISNTEELEFMAEKETQNMFKHFNNNSNNASNNNNNKLKDFNNNRKYQKNYNYLQ